MRPRLRSSLSLGLVGILVVAAAGTANADTLEADADQVVSGTPTLNIGDVCRGAAGSKSVELYLDRQGGGAQVWASSATVTITTPGASTAQGSVAASSASISLPSDWVTAKQSDDNDKVSQPAVVPVTVDAPASAVLGAGTAEVSYRAVGPGDSAATHADSVIVRVNWNVVGCAPANQAPVVTLEGPQDGATYEYGAAPLATCTWADGGDSGQLTPAYSGPTGPRGEDGLGEVTVGCSFTDAGDPPLTGSASATYTVVDTTAPAVPALTDVAAPAVDASGAHVDYIVPDATDVVDGSVPLSCAPGAGSLFGIGSTSVTCTATDQEGNTESASFLVTVADEDAPEVTVPDAMTVDATSQDGAVVTYAATAQDNVDGALEPVCLPASGTTFAFGNTLVTCTVADSAGNEGSASFGVTVQDVTAPVVTVPSLEPVEATGPDGAVVTWDPVTANDDVDGPLDATCVPASGGEFALGDTPVTCTATDENGNTGSAQFVVTVADTTGPEITAPEDLTVEATSPMGAVVEYVASATDLVDGAVGVECTPTSGSQFALGSTLVTCTGVDSSGNEAAPAQFTVTVVDTTPPTLPVLSDVSGVEATGPDGAVVSYSVGAAQDLVDGPVFVSCEPASDSTFAVGVTTVTCTSTDAADNAATGTFTVEVVDTTAPVFEPVSLSTAEATASAGAQVEFTAVANDTVDPSPVVDCTPASGSWFPIGATEVGCSATDASGNEGTTTFVVNVADTTEPVVSSLPSVTLEATSDAGAVHEYDVPSATDVVDGETTVTCAPESGSTFPLGETTVTCTSTDNAGNEGTSSAVVTVVDTTAPEMADVDDIVVAATSASGAVVTYDAPTATDLVDGAVAVTCDMPSGSSFPLGTTTVTCTAEDAAGNGGTASFLVRVEVAWSGYLQPVEPGGPRTFKQGSTIPVKFALTGASQPISTLEARLYVRRTGAEGTTAEAEAVSTAQATTGNLFRYSDGQYVFNLATKNLQKGTYELRVDLGDGVARTTTIVLR